MNYDWAAGHSALCATASEAVRTAEKALLATLREEYPTDCSVRVVHSRGEFRGTAVGHDHFGSRVMVKNSCSGKVGKWWFRQVEVVR